MIIFVHGNFTVLTIALYSALIRSKRCFFEVSTLARLASESSTSSPWGLVVATSLGVGGTCAKTSGVWGASEGIAEEEDGATGAACDCGGSPLSGESSKIPTGFQYLGWTAEEARSCEAWFQSTFRPQKWNLKAHMWYQLSPFTGSNVAMAMQHHPGNIHHSALLRYSVLCFYSITQCNWHGIETMTE